MANDGNDARLEPEVRKKLVEDIAAEMKSVTMKLVADMEAEFDEHSKELHKMVKKATIEALEAMEKDMIADMEQMEVELDFDGGATFDKIYHFADYYHGPRF